MIHTTYTFRIYPNPAQATIILELPTTHPGFRKLG
ncbi:TPA: helix-turn-helix domain-containing protein [Bacillus cereus]